MYNWLTSSYESTIDCNMKKHTILFVFGLCVLNLSSQDAVDMVGLYYQVDSETGDTIQVTTCTLWNDSTLSLVNFMDAPGWPYGALRVSVLEDGQLFVDQSFFQWKAILSFEGDGQFTAPHEMELNLHYTVDA